MNAENRTKNNLAQPFGTFDTERALPTLNHWHDIGGLVGRGVLLDVKAYFDSQGKELPCFESTKIYTSDLEATAKWEGVELRQGDILLVRSGITDHLTGASEEKQGELLGSHRTVGVWGHKDTARWFWNHHFSAVAGDMLAFEQIPPVRESGEEGGIGELVLHQYFLSLFGLHIGELWDLKRLSEVCKEKGRYSFLLTSVPLNVPGLVGSPPNALAIF